MAHRTYSSSRGGDVPPSSTKHSAEHVTDTKYLQFRDKVPLTEPRDLNVVWDDFVHVVTKGGNSEELNAEDLKAFAVVLNKSYDAEATFAKALFVAMKKCLSAHKLIQADPPTKDDKYIASYPIVFNYGLLEKSTGDHMYAIGIARQANGERHVSGKSHGQTSALIMANSRLFHGTCLLTKPKRGGNWIVVKCFSVVKLKVATGNNCAVVGVDCIDNDKKVRSIALKSGSGALLQALMYTWEWIFSSHTEVEELKDLSWAAIIAKKKKKKDGNANENPGEEKAGEEEADDEVAAGKKECEAGEPETMESSEMPANHYRWVSGKIFVPDYCGGSFEYSATGCGNWKENDNCASVKMVVSVYLDTLLFGLEAAQKMLDVIQANKQNTVGPFPTSGKRLEFGGVELRSTEGGMKLRGKPMVGGILLNALDDDNGHWTASQGEIFTGKLNFYELKQQLAIKQNGRYVPAVVVFKDDDEEVDVVVKVSSLSVHKFLNHPDKAFVALSQVDMANLRIRMDMLLNPGKRMKLDESWDLFNVLYAFQKMPNTLITIMADLSGDYRVLSPERDKLTCSVLWLAFHDLVWRILLPLADIAVIHPDIRPGWDFTSNILYIKESQLQHQKPSMQLIDFDSLVLCSDWVHSTSDNFKYRRYNTTWTPYTFLWWQCVSVAFAWKMKKSQIEMENIELANEFGQNSWLTMLGKDFCDLAKVEEIEKRQLEESLATLRDQILSMD